MIRVTVTEPVLHDYDGDLTKGWYVDFYAAYPDDPGTQKRVPVRAYINREKTVTNRHRAGRNLIVSIKKAIDDGWNPFAAKFEDWIRDKVAERSLAKNRQVPLGQMGFMEALRYGLAEKKKQLAHRSYTIYDNQVGYAEMAAAKIGLTYKPISNVERVDCKQLLRQIQVDRNWTAHAYNKGLDILSSICSVLLDDDIIKYNPFFKIKRQEWVEVNCPVTPTDAEQQLIKAHLFQHHYHFFVVVIALYHTGIRTKELLGLRVGDLDAERMVFRLLPGDERTKTKKERIVPINPHLWSHIEKMNLWKYPGEWQIFSHGFVPGPKRLNRNQATDYWRVNVKNTETGLGIDVNMYAMKHKGADDKILAGIDLDALRELYGHSSKFMTEKYARKVKEVYRKQIIDKSPEF